MSAVSAEKVLRLHDEIEDKSIMRVNPRPGDDRIPDPTYVRRALAGYLRETLAENERLRLMVDAAHAKVFTVCAVCDGGIHSVASHWTKDRRTITFWAHDDSALDEAGGHIAFARAVAISLEGRSAPTTDAHPERIVGEWNATWRPEPTMRFSDTQPEPLDRDNLALDALGRWDPEGKGGPFAPAEVWRMQAAVDAVLAVLASAHKAGGE